jgi:hypothetical protein
LSLCVFSGWPVAIPIQGKDSRVTFCGHGMPSTRGRRPREFAPAPSVHSARANDALEGRELFDLPEDGLRQAASGR